MKPAFNLFDSTYNRQRWVCYFDILGFKNLVEQNSVVSAVHTYYRSREVVERWLKRASGIKLFCFSDTYILYSRDDSKGQFAEIEQVARFILNQNIHIKIPIRGALSCGEFYAHPKNKVFIGRALLEAYAFGESQNWIGLILCRSATKQMAKLGLPPAERLNYRRWKIPFKDPRKPGKRQPGQWPLYAYLIGASSPTNGRNIYRDAIQEMKNMATTRKVKKKCDNTLRFLDHFGILQPARRAQLGNSST